MGTEGRRRGRADWLGGGVGGWAGWLTGWLGGGVGGWAGWLAGWRGDGVAGWQTGWLVGPVGLAGWLDGLAG